jgi:hypothetical protein
MGWEAVLLLIASFVISAALAPKIKPPAPTAFEDIDFPQAEEGTPQAVIFGDCWSGDWTVLTVGNYRTEGIESDEGK